MRKKTVQQGSTISTVDQINSITEEHIRQKAFEFYLARGGTPGSDQDDWFRAEKELRSGGY